LLEDRQTPSVSLNFFPVAHVAVNPQPLPPGESLPPSALVEFDPTVVGIPALDAGSKEPLTFRLSGALSKAITIPPTTAGTPGQTWSLEAFYDLTANETVTNLPPDPFTGQEGVSDTFSLTGTIAEILSPVAPTTGATWVFNGTMSEQGTFMSAVSPPDPATGMQQLTGEWKYSNLTLERGLAPNTGLFSWIEQIHSGSIGSLVETLTPGTSSTSPSATATFWQQDQATECLMQVIPFHPPQPCITIDAVFTTWGSVTDKVLIPPGPAVFPEVDTGTTQYTDQLAETILMPDGSTQTLAQTSMDMGSFVAFYWGVHNPGS